MGAFGGSMTFTTFHVRGEVEPDFRDRFLKGIQREAFRPLTVEEEDEESIGWVAIEHPFDTELDYDKVFYNSYLNLGLRIDRWRIPGALYKAHFTEAARDYLSETGKERLSRRDKEDLKAIVTASLRRQTIPAMKVIDLSWNLDTGVLRFWNQSTRVHEVLEDVFESSFQLSMVRDTPYVVASHSGIDEQQLDVLTTLDPTPFHAKGNLIAAVAESSSAAEGA